MMNFPLNDDDFEEVSIDKVRASERAGGWEIRRSDGFSFFIDKDSPIAPQVGMTARFYPKGIGFSVRGLFLDGQKVYYRTSEEEREHQDEQRYGKDAVDWLAKWDRGETCWSIEMGGLCPGYEQCIHIVVAECLRYLIGANVPRPCDEDETKVRWDAMREASFKNETLEKLGLSGAQYGAGANLAWQIYQRGPIDVMRDPKVKDRHIQVSKNFPGAS